MDDPTGLGTPTPWGGGPQPLYPWPMAHGPWPMAHGPWAQALPAPVLYCTGLGPWPRALIHCIYKGWALLGPLPTPILVVGTPKMVILGHRGSRMAKTAQNLSKPVKTAQNRSNRLTVRSYVKNGQKGPNVTVRTGPYLPTVSIVRGI